MASDKKNLGEGSFVEEKPAVCADLSTFAKLLPTYDGNKRTLAFYIESVENALNLIVNSRDDQYICCLIRNKLTGRAVEALSQSPGAKTWPEIKNALHRKFGEFRTELQLVQELIQTNRENNSLEAFGDKIRNLMSTLISIEPTKRTYYEQMALDTFLDKLNPITAILIRLKHVENLEQAITVAKQEETKLRNRRMQQNKSNPSKNATSTNKSSFQQKPNTFQKKDKFKKPSENSENKNKIHYQEIDYDEEEQQPSEEDLEENSHEETLDENFLLEVEEHLAT